MGLVVFLKFAFKCFDLLAWPLFGLGYPLCASIRAIENNSNLEMRNLVAYWILFCLVSLFELALMKLIDRIPFWPYIKLMVMCFLVLPYFNGASYVYDCLLRPCLSADVRGAIKSFVKPKEEKSHSAKVFLDVAERYVEETGSEALEKLLDRKKHTKPDIAMEEIKAVTNTEEKETAAAIRSKYEEPNVGKVDARALEQPEKTPLAAKKLSKVEEPRVGKENADMGHLKDKNPAVATEQVKCLEPNLAQNKETVAAAEIQEKTVAAAGEENKAVEITDSEKVQREWACALCQVTTPFEQILESHLQGRKHKAKLKMLTASKEVNKNDGSLSLASSSAASSDPKKTPAVDRPKRKRNKKKECGLHEKEVKCVEPSDMNKIKICVEPNLAQIEKNKVAAEAIEEKTVAAAGEEENKAVKMPDMEKVQRVWTCALCQVPTPCEKILESHLQGRKHKVQELKASKGSKTPMMR